MLKKLLDRAHISKLIHQPDIFLALLVITVVALLTLPIPVTLIDILISANLAFCLTVLLLSIYIKSSLNFSSFPTILLLAALFRLGLNIATSRLILLDAHAGEMVLAFGNIMVGGNLVVGIVIFLLLMLINLLVVAKGSERVAEVAARFTLDAMPGKQMSIDADLRAGILDQEGAQNRRKEIERHSQLFGAMDGAMKFVKGDVIAGIIIFFINIVAGVIIGVFQESLDLEDALSTYAILSVGDGLVSIVPGLLMSVAAGLIVTRVDSGAKSLSQNLGQEIFAHPKALMLSALFLVLLSIIPGLPTMPLLLLSFLLLGLSFLTITKEPESSTNKAIKNSASVQMVPISIEVASNLVPWVDDKTNFFSELIPILKESLAHELGFEFPGLIVSQNPELLPNHYQILINEITMAEGEALPDQCMVKALPHELLALDIKDAVQMYNPHINAMVSLTSIKNQAILEQKGYLLWDVKSRILLHTSALLRKNSPDFLSIHESQLLLDRLEKVYPNLVKEVVPSRVNLFQLTDVLKRLLGEEVSIKDLKTILQALAEFAPYEPNTGALTEHVRVALARYLCFRFGHGPELRVMLLAFDIEDIIRTSIVNQAGNSYLALEPDIAKDIIAAVKKVVEELPFATKKPVLLTTKEIRRFVRKLIELEFYSVPVMSFEELNPDYKIQVVGRITLEEVLEELPLSFDELSGNPISPVLAMQEL